VSQHLTAARAGERFAAAIAATTDCHQACVEAMSLGLQQRGEAAHLLHARLMLDSAEVCDTTRDLMLRSSDFAHQMAGLCADVCEQCAISCERMGEPMAACAQACRACVEACRAIR
jgi:hypothetical protein